MKQTLGFTAIVAMAVAAVRIPSAVQSAVAPSVETLHTYQAHTLVEPTPQVPSNAVPGYLGGCSAFDLPRERDQGGRHAMAPSTGAARAVIDSFFGLAPGVSLRGQRGVGYVIAFAPDPRHTNLSLWFDREITAIQQAAQDEQYTYNSSWMPWTSGSEASPLLDDQLRAEEQTDQREACPGVILFRSSVGDNQISAKSQNTGDDAEPPYAKALVVLVVGDQPTGGVNETQWANAVFWLNHNAYVPATPEELAGRPLSILGPSFSGSFTSLGRDLARLPAPGSGDHANYVSTSTPINILSGTTTSCSSVRWFQQRLDTMPAGKHIRFGVFQENDELQIFRFLNYLSQQGYHGSADSGNSEVAILSEDETAYAAPGSSTSGAPALSSCSFPYTARNQPLAMAYPRDISALRVAYEKQSVFSGAASEHASHPILQEDTGSASEAGNATDTIRPLSGLNAVAQEAVMYGLVSYLRAHHSRFLLLRCTNPLDTFFLTRFFHRAYPEGRVVTMGSDLFFRREIDTTEFRGVLSLSNYPLLPRNQHWSHVTLENSSTSTSHTHRVFDSQLQADYLAARYLFSPALAAPCRRAETSGTDEFEPCRAPSFAHTQPVVLPFLAEMPDFAPPFWLEDSPANQAPTWISVVGRDGYWPLSVLNDQSTPNCEALDRPAAPRRCPVAGAPPAGQPPSTIVTIQSSGTQHDLSPHAPPKYSGTVLFRVPLPLKMGVWCAILLLAYQSMGMHWGRRYTSLGLFAIFRGHFTESHAVLLGINSGLAAAILTQLIWVAARTPETFIEGIVAFERLILIVILLVAVVLGFAFYRLEHGHVSAPSNASVKMSLAGSAAARRRRYTLLTLIPFLSILLFFTVISFAIFFPYEIPANGIPLFYRMSHPFSGVSPLLPVVVLIVGFYVWTWQALAGSVLLCSGHPLLPRLASPPGSKPLSRFRSAYLRFVGLESNSEPGTVAAPASEVNAPADQRTEVNEAHLLGASEYRISSAMEHHILKAAAPLSFQLRVFALPMLAASIAIYYMASSGLPLHSLESVPFAAWINVILLFGFLLTTTEAGRFFFTWLELRRLLTALARRRLRRTFAKLRAISVGSLWSVSGNVQRIQYHFLTQQLDAGNRLARLAKPECPLTVKAVAAGRAFACMNASRIDEGPQWERAVPVDAETYPELKGVDSFFIRDVLNDAVGEVINQVLLPAWRKELDSLNLQTRPATAEEHQRNVAEVELSSEPLVRAAEEFVCLHYIAFIQNVLGRMRTMMLSMISLFVAVCLSISFYPFVPRTQIAIWMLLNLVLIASAVIYVYAGMEHDETLSYITNTPVGKLGADFYVKTASFLAGPVIGLLTTQFPAISESFLSWIQPGFDALK